MPGSPCFVSRDPTSCPSHVHSQRWASDQRLDRDKWHSLKWNNELRPSNSPSLTLRKRGELGPIQRELKPQGNERGQGSHDGHNSSWSQEKAQVVTKLRQSGLVERRKLTGGRAEMPRERTMRSWEPLRQRVLQAAFNSKCVPIINTLFMK